MKRKALLADFEVVIKNLLQLSKSPNFPGEGWGGVSLTKDQIGSALCKPSASQQAKPTCATGHNLLATVTTTSQQVGRTARTTASPAKAVVKRGHSAPPPLARVLCSQS